MPHSPFVTEKLPNGLTVVMEVMPHVQSASCGFLVRTGSRNDPPEIAGVSHYLEHMCFKGTPRRTWNDINIAFDELGSHYNAYTSKDRTFYYGWVSEGDLDPQLELLADMMGSSLPEGEFDTEKGVILEEIAMSNDDLASCAYDALYERLCADSSMAWPVLGYERTIERMTRDQMAGYFRRRYSPENLVLVVAGNIEPEQVLRSVERHCGRWSPASDRNGQMAAPGMRSGVTAQKTDRFHQQAVLLAFPSAAGTSELDETAEAAASILGGANSRFYWNIVQEGLCARAGVMRDEYADCGVVIMYGLCEPEKADELLAAMRHEARKMTTDGVEAKEIQRVKNLRRTSLAMESEAPYYRLGQIADDVEYFGRPRPAAERLAAVDAVSEATIRTYLDQYPITGEGLLVSVGPREWPTNR
jgi:predicted Zn-dependent peptidase